MNEERELLLILARLALSDNKLPFKARVDIRELVQRITVKPEAMAIEDMVFRSP